MRPENKEKRRVETSVFAEILRLPPSRRATGRVRSNAYATDVWTGAVSSVGIFTFSRKTLVICAQRECDPTKGYLERRFLVDGGRYMSCLANKYMQGFNGRVMTGK